MLTPSASGKQCLQAVFLSPTGSKELSALAPIELESFSPILPSLSLIILVVFVYTQLLVRTLSSPYLLLFWSICILLPFLFSSASILAFSHTRVELDELADNDRHAKYSERFNGM